MKDFDKWNVIKKDLEFVERRKKYHAGDIWWIRMGLNIGFEQDGKNENFERPVLVIKGFSREVCLVVPLTTRYKNNKFSLFVGKFDEQRNYAILSQIRLIDTKRLMNKIGAISKNELNLIKDAIWNIIR